MGNKSRKQKCTWKKTRMNFTKKARRPVKSTHDNMNRIRTQKRTDINQDDTSVEAYSNYTRLLQLFPYLHPVAIDRIFANCNRDFIRTIDNLLYIKRYFYFVQTNDCHPHTATTTDPNHVFVHHFNKPNHTNTDCTSTKDMQQDNSNNDNVDGGDGYIPNGNIEGIREQIRMYEEQQCSKVNILPLSQCNTSVDYNFHTSTPQVRLQEETCYLQLGLTNCNLLPLS